MKIQKWKCRRCGELVKETPDGKRCGCIISPCPWEPVDNIVNCPDCGAELKIDGGTLIFVKHVT